MSGFQPDPAFFDSWLGRLWAKNADATHPTQDGRAAEVRQIVDELDAKRHQ